MLQLRSKKGATIAQWIHLSLPSCGPRFYPQEQDLRFFNLYLNCEQCDQKKIAKSLQKLPKNDFTRKMKDLTPSQKLPKNVEDLGKLIVGKGFKKLPKPQ